MDPNQRRALRNGVVAAAVTAVALFVVDAAIPGGREHQATPSASPSPACTASWEVVPGVDPDPIGNQLLGVAAVSEDDAWAVGGSGPADAPTSTLVERWDGRLWFVVASPNDGSTVNVLNAVAVTRSGGVWAVGRTSSGAEDLPLIEHWNGTAWTISPPPTVVGGAVLYGVAVAGRTVWAVGASGSPTLGTEQALILRWDGATWTPQPIPALPGRSLLRAVAARTPNDVWAVGYRDNRPLVLRFRGNGWQQVPVEAGGPLVAISPVSARAAWAVGSSIQRWDGSAWIEAGTVRRQGDLAGVAAVSAEEVWAVGSSPALQPGVSRALVQRFDGKRWTPVRGQMVPGSEALTAAASLSDGTLWAAGYRDTATRRATLIVRGSVTCA